MKNLSAFTPPAQNNRQVPFISINMIGDKVQVTVRSEQQPGEISPPVGVIELAADEAHALFANALNGLEVWRT